MTIRPWWLWGLGIIGVAIVALLAVIAFALVSDDGGTSTELAQISKTATPGPGLAATATPQATPSPTPPAATPEPSPTPCPDCPEPTPCPEETPCPACPEPITCPACICPACPTALDLRSDLCASLKVLIEIAEIRVDVAEKGRLVGGTETEARTRLAGAQRDFDQECQGVPLAKPSALASGCALAGEEVGVLRRDLLYNADVQTQIWANQVDDIVGEYCKP